MHSSKDIEAEIAGLKAQADALPNALDTLYLAFADELPKQVEIWIRERVKGTIEGNASKIAQAGIEPVRALKADIEDLVSRLGTVCREALGPKPQWPHRSASGAPRPPSANSGSEPPGASQFRSAVSSLGAVLAKHGLVNPLPGHTREWEPKAPGKFIYAFNPGFDGKKFPSLQRYQDQLSRLRALEAQIQAKQKELEQARARELWDQA
jgi:hypothetical protein